MGTSKRPRTNASSFVQNKAAKTIVSMFKKASKPKRPQSLAPESKEVTTLVSGTIYGGLAANGSSITLLNSVATGTDTNSRIGRKVTHRYVEVDVSISCGATATLGDWGSWYIVLDRQPNGATFAITDFLDNSVVTAIGNAPRNTLLYQDRFTVMAHETYSVGIQSQGSEPYHMKRFVSLSGLKDADRTATYNSVAAGIGSLNNGAVFFVVTQGATTIVGATATVVLAGLKYRFYDV